MNADDAIADACSMIPGLVRGALALLPEGLLIGGVGEARAFEHEPLVRSAVRCLSGGPAPGLVEPAAALVEFLFVNEDHVLAIQRARGARLALAVICTREPNVALVLSSSRRAMHELERKIDLGAWEV